MSTKRIFITVVTLFLLPLFSSAQTLSDLESKIAALLAQIQTLQTELQTLKSTEVTPAIPQTSSSTFFTTTLGKGSEGSEVTKLQQYLAKDPALYPEGLVSGYYGALTEAAVKRFQQKHNIVSSGTPATTGYGLLGPKTRAVLNSLFTTTPLELTTPTEPTSNGAGTSTAPYNTPNTPNRSPNLSITGSRFVTLPNKVTLTAVATDDGKPAGTLTYLWSKASGPGTVSFSSLTTKDISASFSSAGTYQITATVSDSDLFASYTIALIVSPASTTATTSPTTTLPPLALTFTASKTTLTKGTATTLTWSSTNAISCTAGSGWSGSKTASGTSTLTPQTTTTYTLSCAGTEGDTITKEVIVIVTAAAINSQTPYSGTAIALPGTIQAEHFDKDGEGIAYHETDTTNNGGAFRTAEGVDIQTTKDSTGSYDVGWTKGGEWLEYSVNVTTAGTYVLDARVASDGQGGNFHVEMAGADITGSMTAPDTGGWQNWTTITSPSFSLTAGSHILRLAMETSSAVTQSIANFNFLTIRVPGSTPPPPSGDTVSLYGTWEKSFTNNKSYSNPYDFNEIQLNAVFTAPSGKKVNFFGFHDGDGNGGQNGNIWKLRFLPTEVGTWTYIYSWSDGTTGGSGSFTATNDGKYKGVLQSYTANPHWLAYNGTDPVFLKSYYIVTGDFTGIPTNWAISNVYQKIVDRGYNHVQLNMLPIGYVYQDLLDSPSHYGTPLWGDNPVTDQRMNVWKRMEEHVSWLNDHNVGIHFFQGIDPKPTTGADDDPTLLGDPRYFPQKRWASMSAYEKEWYVKYVVARLAPYANIAGWNYTWEVATSRDNGPFELAELLAQYDLWNHLRTYHDEKPESNNFGDTRFTFAAIENHLNSQQWPEVPRDSYSHHKTTLASYANKPVFMSEGNGLWRSCYYSPKNGRLKTPEEIEEGIRRSAWGVTTAGGSFTWDDLASCEGDNRSTDIFSLSIADSVDILYRILEQDVTFQNLNPRDDLLTYKGAEEVWALAELGKQYLVYAEAGADFELSIASGTYTATWINTQTNARQNANGGSVTGGTRSFTPPNSGDWVLVLKK